MIIVTGATGFIGSSFIKFLNDKGIDNIVAIDKFDGMANKLQNVSDLKCKEFVFIKGVNEIVNKIYQHGQYIEHFVHMGAITSTTELDFEKLYNENYKDTLEIELATRKYSIPFLYASSANVYGLSNSFSEESKNENSTTLYGFSKLLTDNSFRNRKLFDNPTIRQLVGLRFFNVCGSRESHKLGQCSPIYNYFKNPSNMIVYKGIDPYQGDFLKHSRDFVYINDVCEVMYWFMKNSNKSGIFNVGSGTSRTFSEVAQAVKSYIQTKNDSIEISINYVAPPVNIKNIQPYTCADLTKLREIGCNHEFLSLEEMVERIGNEISCS